MKKLSKKDSFLNGNDVEIQDGGFLSLTWTQRPHID